MLGMGGMTASEVNCGTDEPGWQLDTVEARQRTIRAAVHPGGGHGAALPRRWLLQRWCLELRAWRRPLGAIQLFSPLRPQIK